MQFMPEGRFSALALPQAFQYLSQLTHYIEENWDDEAKRRQAFSWLSRYLATWVNHAEKTCRDLAALLPRFQRPDDIKHFVGLAVAIERAGQQGIRDDEFLVTTSDHGKPVQEKIPLTLILDNIRSAFNVGAIFRTADCLGVEKVILTGYTATPDDSKTRKTAMSADSHVEWQWMRSTTDALTLCRDRDIPVVALETAERSQEIFSFSFPKPCALLVGNERFGLESDILRHCHAVAHIPVYGVKNSLNVAMALGIAGFEVRRQWREK